MANLPPAKSPAPQLLRDNLYKLKFVKANMFDSMLVSIPGVNDISEAVARAQEYCKASNRRFMFLEPAITVIGEMKGEITE